MCVPAHQFCRTAHDISGAQTQLTMSSLYGNSANMILNSGFIGRHDGNLNHYDHKAVTTESQ